MESPISSEEVEVIEKFIARIKQGSVKQDFLYRNHSQADIDLVFPAIRKLLEFGAKEVKGSHHDYALYYTNSADNPILLFGLTIENTQMIQELLTQYRLAELNAAKARFLSMKVTDMTGADLAQFLQLIGK